jgi:hypothetical protein
VTLEYDASRSRFLKELGMKEQDLCHESTDRKFKQPNQSIAQEINNHNAPFIAVDPKLSPRT